MVSAGAYFHFSKDYTVPPPVEARVQETQKINSDTSLASCKKWFTPVYRIVTGPKYAESTTYYTKDDQKISINEWSYRMMSCTIILAPGGPLDAIQLLP